MAGLQQQKHQYTVEAAQHGVSTSVDAVDDGDEAHNAYTGSARTLYNDDGGDGASPANSPNFHHANNDDGRNYVHLYVADVPRKRSNMKRYLKLATEITTVTAPTQTTALLLHTPDDPRA